MDAIADPSSGNHAGGGSRRTGVDPISRAANSVPDTNTERRAEPLQNRRSIRVFGHGVLRVSHAAMSFGGWSRL